VASLAEGKEQFFLIDPDVHVPLGVLRGGTIVVATAGFGVKGPSSGFLAVDPDPQIGARRDFLHHEAQGHGVGGVGLQVDRRAPLPEVVFKRRGSTPTEPSEET
jgi:hypothetical protein